MATDDSNAGAAPLSSAPLAGAGSSWARNVQRTCMGGPPIGSATPRSGPPSWKAGQLLLPVPAAARTVEEQTNAHPIAATNMRQMLLFPLSLRERVGVRAKYERLLLSKGAQPRHPLTPALSQREREQMPRSRAISEG